LFKNARIVTVALVLIFAPLGLAQADETSSRGTIAVPGSVTAPPPAHVHLQTTSIAAGIGVSWGEGTLSFEGERYPLSVKGLTLGEIGGAKIVASGGVNNIQSASDLEGTYIAVEVGAAAVKGASMVTMRNRNGVTLTLQAENKGVRLALAAKGISITLK